MNVLTLDDSMKIFSVFLCIVVLNACTSVLPRNSSFPNENLGIDHEAITNMAMVLVQSLLHAMPKLAGKRIIIDAEYLTNESSNMLNKNLIVDKIRAEFRKAEHENRAEFRKAEHEEITYISPDTRDKIEIPLSAHYRLSGKISSLDMIDSKTGARQRYTQIVVEFFDLKTGESIWESIYELKRTKPGMPLVYR